MPFWQTWYGDCVSTYPAKPPSGRQSQRLCLPVWLRDGAHRLLALEYAVAVGDPSLVPTDVLKLVVVEADSVARQRARHFLLGHALAPHARWETKGKETPELTVPELETLLTGLATEGDKAAILALLAAKDPARYGPPARAQHLDPGDGADTDVPEWTPRVKRE